MATKTNAARILDSMGISYELRDYDPGDEHLTASEVAQRVGLPPEQVFKTLVVRGDRHGVAFAVVPANAELDFKALAKLTGDRKVDTVPLKEVTPLTGYVRGGTTALASKKDYPVFVDETIELFDQIAVSAGVRGTQLVLAPADYLRATKAKTGDIGRTLP
jgi:Cys-tRNA(Pro)/Cys-tRNA(Cys) deacylase